MTNIESRPLAIDDPATYRIELQGVLGSSWQDFVRHMQIQVRRAESGSVVTTLTGVVRDQAALAGILNLVYDLGMPLLSVEWLGSTDDRPL